VTIDQTHILKDLENDIFYFPKLVFPFVTWYAFEYSIYIPHTHFWSPLPVLSKRLLVKERELFGDESK